MAHSFQDFETIRSYWEHRAATASSHKERIDHSARSQRMRYASFLEIHSLEDKSILDVGCGLADLRAELDRRKVTCEYVGFDIAQEMIRRCKLRFPGVRFESGNIMEWQSGRSFDYVASFGIHSNVRVGAPYEMLQSMTRRQFELCSVAAHISLLTDRFTGFDPEVQSWNAEKVLSLCLEITPFVILRHDYLPHDFSVTLYRQPLIDRNPEILEG